MDLYQNLKLERYKMVCERQKYFTELAKESFNSYVKMFVSFTAAAVALIYFKKQLDVDPKIVISLLRAISVLLTLVALITISQIIFCLKRWYGLRKTEHEINPDCPPPEMWAWLFEGLYAFAIAGSIYVTWTGFKHFLNILNNVPLK